MRLALFALPVLLSIVYGQSGRPVEISAPANESVFRTGSDVTLIARCPTNSASVRFVVDGASIGEAPCGGAFVWKGAPSGIHAISGVLGTESEPVLVFVNDSATRPRVESIQGVVRAVVEDRFGERTSHTYYSISAKGASIPIAFPTAAVRAAVRSGKPVTLEGFRDSGRFYPRLTEVAEAEDTTAPLAAFGVRRVAVILINYLNQTSQPITQAQAASLMTTVNQYYQEASYQQFSVTGDVYGYLNLPINETCSGASSAQDSSGGAAFSAITSAGVQAARAAGIDLSPYQSYIFIGPTATQCYGGYATIGGSSPGLVLIRVNVFDPRQYAIIVHEVGHNLGFYHPQSFACSTSTIYNPAVNCGSLDAGDLFDVMGGAAGVGETPHFNASYKDQLGWVTPKLVSTGAYNIAPTEITGGGAKAMAVAPLGGNDSFYIEFRQPFGFDSTLLSSQVYNGALMHLGGNPAFILDMHPATTAPSTEPLQPALLAGEKYTDYANRFSITTVSVSPAALQVRVLIPSLSSPTAMFVSPANGSVIGGSVTIAADALDLTAVTKVNLYIDDTLIGTQSGSVSQAGAVVLNENYAFPWDTTKETTGTHQLAITAYNATGASFNTSISVAVHRLPTISLIAPVNGLATPAGNSVTLSAQAASPETGVSIAQVEFFANGAPLGLGTLAGAGVYNLTWSPSAAGAYSISATATDSNGLTASTAPAAVTFAGPVITSVNVVDGGATISQNTWIEIYGSNLTPSTVPSNGLTWSSAPSFAQDQMPTQLNGVSVTVNGVPAYVAFISQGQIDVLTPLDSRIGTVPIVVTNGAASSPPFSVIKAGLSPAFALAGGTKYLAATHANGTYVAPATPATPGEEIVLYGFGFVFDTSAQGSSIQSAALPVLPTVQIGGQSAQVVFAGLISPGLYQFNVVVPPTASNGDNPVTAVYDGVAISTAGLIPVQGSN